MAWIESHQSLGKHKKVLRLAGLLKTKRVQLVGHLHYLWWWGMDNADIDGRLGDVTAFEIAEAAEWEGDPEEFVEALVSVGFVEIIDGQYILHDWYDYAGKLNERRERDRQRKRTQRKSSQAPGDGPEESHKDVHENSSGRPADIRRRSECTQPNLTIPNHDDDTRARASEDDEDAELRDLILAVVGAAYGRSTADELDQDIADIGVDAVKEAMRRSVERATGNRLSYYRTIVKGWRGKVRSLEDIRKLDEAVRPPARDPPRRLSTLELAAQAKGGQTP